MDRLLALVLSLFSPADMTARVAVEASCTLHTQAVVIEEKKCCGQCRNGIITHADGHRTPCPCPATCPCKAKADCPDGKCVLKR